MLALLRVACLASDSTGDGTALTYDETETEAVFIPPSNYTTAVFYNVASCASVAAINSTLRTPSRPAQGQTGYARKNSGR